MAYTERQIVLFYNEAIAHEHEAHANQIVATNLGFAGGNAAKKAVEQLTGKAKVS
jgi:hypothetical protein